MIDNLTSGDIVNSFDAPLRRLLQLSENPASLERYVRRSIRSADYEESVTSCDTPAWERAFAHVVMLQDFVRLLDGRERDAKPPKEEPSERDRYLKALAETDLGYTHDPSWTNGGIASHGGDPVPDDPSKRSVGPALRRVAAFGKVVQVDGVPDLAWYFAASSFELGVSSIQDAMVARMLLGVAMGGPSGSSPEGPTDDQIHAANLQRRILERLGQLPHRLQAVLELAYTDRRYENLLVAEFGVGIAPIVWRAAYRAGEVTAAGAAHPSHGTLRELVADVRAEWSSYDCPQKGQVKARIAKAAELLLWTAHARYHVAAGQEPPRAPRGRKGGAGLAAAGTRGRKRRQLTQVPRKAA